MLPSPFTRHADPKYPLTSDILNERGYVPVEEGLVRAKEDVNVPEFGVPDTKELSNRASAFQLPTEDTDLLR
jgi:hypothetical protein